MNITKHSLAAIALAVTISVGGTATAFAGNGDDGTTDGSAGGSKRDQLIEKICADPDAAVAKMNTHRDHVTERIARLTELRATAESNGRTRLVNRIDQRLERLEKSLARITDRIDQAPAWIAEHCA